jgi:transposase
MRSPASISPWLDDEELAAWVQEASDKFSYQKRLAIWLTHTGSFHAQRVADLLQVSKQAVWLWLGQYNREGPSGLKRSGRGGRRWAFLSWEAEEALLGRFEKRALKGEVVTAKMLWSEVSAALGRKISLDYIYRLMHRHQWRKLSPRPSHVKANPRRQEAFKKNSPKRSGHS